LNDHTKDRVDEFGSNVFSQQQLQQPISLVGGNSGISNEHAINSGPIDESTIKVPWTALQVVCPVQFNGVPNGVGTFHPFDNHLGGLELGWEMPKHVFGSTFMNGEPLSPRHGFQFVGTGNLGHELSFPMQTHEATFMQGQPSGTNMWGDTGLANPSPPHSAQGSAPLCVPNTSPQLPAVILCNYPTCNKAFKRDADRSRHEYSVHYKSSGLRLCPITGCPKSYRKGYSRSDKVTEHLWKKHANLGFTKA
jgi:hypothetical protein